MQLDPQTKTHQTDSQTSPETAPEAGKIGQNSTIIVSASSVQTTFWAFGHNLTIFSGGWAPVPAVRSIKVMTHVSSLGWGS